MTATLTIPSARAATMAAVPHRAGSVQQRPGSQAAQQREDAERRQEQPDPVVARRVRQRPQDHQERPVPGDQQPDRLARAVGPPPRPSPSTPMTRNPTGVTSTVQTIVLYQGSDCFGRVVDRCRGTGP